MWRYVEERIFDGLAALGVLVLGGSTLVLAVTLVVEGVRYWHG